MGEALLESIKKRIFPGSTSMSIVAGVVKQINKVLEDEEVVAYCVVGGSFAKDTHLKGDHDVDLFVRFEPAEYDSDEISDVLYNVLPFDFEEVKGSRNYFQFTHRNLDFEVVPVLKVEKPDEAENVTDMSPLHVSYVSKYVKKNPGLNDEIRLAKFFCKANKVYGAESYIQGFSGHVIDILIIYYGSFMQLMKTAAGWGDRVVIDIEHLLSNPLKQLNKAKIASPLVLVDPIQPDRNAAAALSEDKFDLFKSRCKDFLKNPSESFFKPAKIEKSELERKAGDDFLIILQLWPYKGKNDVMGAKLRQAYDYVFSKVQDLDWNIKESDWEFFKGEKTRSKKKNPDKEPHGTFYFIIDSKIKPYIERKGPPIDKHEDVKKFNKAHRSAYVRGGRLYAKITRKFTDPEQLLVELLQHSYVEERVKMYDLI